MSFFKPTNEEIKAASNGGHITFKHDEEVHMLIKEVAETVKDGKSMIIIKVDVLNTEHKGKEYRMFIRDNQAGWGMWMSILETFMTPEQIQAGFTPSTPVGRKVKTVAKVKASNGKEYCNFYTFGALDDTPTIGAPAEASAAASIPF